jgi:hypothetical protein
MMHSIRYSWAMASRHDTTCSRTPGRRIKNGVKNKTENPSSPYPRARGCPSDCPRAEGVPGGVPGGVPVIVPGPGVSQGVSQ